MKKIVAVVLILMVVLNAVVLWPKSSEAETEECSISKRPKIELTEVNPGILPNLLKSASSAF